jgi:hypothetical protein
VLRQSPLACHTDRRGPIFVEFFSPSFFSFDYRAFTLAPPGRYSRGGGGEKDGAGLLGGEDAFERVRFEEGAILQPVPHRLLPCQFIREHVPLASRDNAGAAHGVIGHGVPEKSHSFPREKVGGVPRVCDSID